MDLEDQIRQAGARAQAHWRLADQCQNPLDAADHLALFHQESARLVMLELTRRLVRKDTA